MNIGANSASNGNKARFLNDLEHLKCMGVNHLRIMAGSEGPDTEPFRTVPALMSAPGIYSQHVLDGLDYAVSEIGKQGFLITMCLSNYWHWSGGFSQYVNWTTNEPIPYPASWDKKKGGLTDGSFDDFTAYASRFYRDELICHKAQAIFRDHIRRIVTRVNTYSGVSYNEDKSILAWELANEPQFPTAEWIKETALYIKSLDKNHLVTVGMESREDHADFLLAHSCNAIDFATIHVWAQNRGTFDFI